MLLLIAALTACADKDAGSGAPLPQTGDRDTADDTAGECGGVEPVIETLRVANGGLYDFSSVIDCADDEDCVYPSVEVTLDVTDVDGDLHQYIIDIWFDDVVDGSVDTSSGGFQLLGSSRGDPCQVTAESFGNLLAVGTGPLPFNTEIEFAAQITDAEGLTSDIAVASGFTPNSDGSDGGRR